MANTTIQLKYSSATATPPSLSAGETAYSFNSQKFFIGNTTGAILTIGGKYYTDIIDAATNANTVSTIVKRDGSGNFSATTVTADLVGNASSSDKWKTARNIGVSGDATGIISVDGSANANIPVVLANTAVTPGLYGGANSYPQITVDSKGRVTAVSNIGISISNTTLNIIGDSGTDSVQLSSDTLDFAGGSGIATTVSQNLVSIAVNNTVLRTTGNQSLTGDLSVTGNLYIIGNTVSQNVSSLIVNDSLIELSANNAADALDIGIFGTYVNAGTKYTAFFRDATDGNYKLLTGGTEKPAVGNTVNVSAFSTGTIVANITGGTVSGLTADISVADGGTGAGSFSSGQLLLGNGTGAIQSLANTGTAGTYGATDRTLTVTTDAWGRVSSITNNAISIAASQIASGTLGVARGGTGNTTFTNNGILLGQGTSAITTVVSSTEGHLLTINSSGIPTFAMLSGGTF